jgi:hypothetical protein
MRGVSAGFGWLRRRGRASSGARLTRRRQAAACGSGVAARGAVASRGCADVDQLARAHLAQVEAKLAQLAALRAELVRIIGACRGGRAVADCQILRALNLSEPPSGERADLGD